MKIMSWSRIYIVLQWTVVGVNGPLGVNVPATVARVPPSDEDTVATQSHVTEEPLVVDLLWKRALVLTTAVRI